MYSAINDKLKCGLYKRHCIGNNVQTFASAFDCYMITFVKNRFISNRRKLLKLGGLSAVLPATVLLRDASAGDMPEILQPKQASDLAFVKRAFDMRDEASRIGDQAYGAVVVREGVIVGQSASHVVVHNDPTAHAEMEAIRDAVRRLGSRDLSDCILYSSSRACPMCEAAAYWANIDRMVYGNNASDAGQPSLC